MNCVSCDICVYHLGLSVFFPGVFLSSRVTGACPVTTDLIMRVNVKTTTNNNNFSFHLYGSIICMVGGIFCFFSPPASISGGVRIQDIISNVICYS